MMRRAFLTAVLALAPTLAAAQFATIAPTPPPGDNGDRIATTSWVNSALVGGLPLASGKIWIGSAGGLATAQTPSGDWTISLTGVAALASVNSNVGSFGSTTQCSTVTVNAKGLITAASAATCAPAIGSVTGLGTGIAAGLAVNVGTAGSPVVNGGALGTPSSGILGTGVTIQGGNVTWTGTIPGGALAPISLSTSGNGGVTGTLPVANGGTGDTGTPWTTFTPTITCGTGGPPTVSSNSAAFKKIGKIIFLHYQFIISANNSCANTAILTLPPSTNNNGGGALAAQEFNSVGWSGMGFMSNGATTVTLTKYDGTNPLDTSTRGWVLSGAFEIQ